MFRCEYVNFEVWKDLVSSILFFLRSQDGVINKQIPSFDVEFSCLFRTVTDVAEMCSVANMWVFYPLKALTQWYSIFLRAFLNL